MITTAIAAIIVFGLPSTPVEGADIPPAALNIAARHRLPSGQDKTHFVAAQKQLTLKPQQTAVIICDMWDKHWCPTSSARVAELAPRINQFANVCRKQGITIIHAPSDTLKFYADSPARKRAMAAKPATNQPEGINAWCKIIPAEEQGKYPIDQTDGGCDCDDPPKSEIVWTRQIESIEIDDERDFVSANGSEIWNVLEERGIANVMLVGVHTNMCVLGRPFGLRNLSRFGKTALLVRDLTDTMYNPKSWPHVSHFRGNDLIVEHIEKYVCPTFASNQILGGERFRFKDDVRPRVVMAISEPEYKTEITVPKFADCVLDAELGYDITVLQGNPAKHELPGLQAALEKADVLLVSIRRQALPTDDVAAIKRYLAAGKPLIGIRTASHAFSSKGKNIEGGAQWTEFDADVLGGNYHGHYGDGAQTTVAVVDAAKDHPILQGVGLPFASNGTLYKTGPLRSSATALLIGSIPKAAPEPIAWTNTSGKSRVFYTSLGHADDFENPSFVRLLSNGVQWCLQKKPE